MKAQIAQVNLRMTPDEYAALSLCAKSLGLTRAAYIRRCVEITCCTLGVPSPSEKTKIIAPRASEHAQHSNT